VAYKPSQVISLFAYCSVEVKICKKIDLRIYLPSTIMDLKLSDTYEWLNETKPQEYSKNLKDTLELQGWDDAKLVTEYLQYAVADTKDWLSKTSYKWKSEKAIEKIVTIVNTLLCHEEIIKLWGKEKCDNIKKTIKNNFNETWKHLPIRCTSPILFLHSLSSRQRNISHLCRKEIFQRKRSLQQNKRYEFL